MDQKRILWIVLVGLLLCGLIFGMSGAVQRNAWMEGYTIGRLSAASGLDGAPAAVAPIAPYAYPGYGHHGPGFGGFLFLFFGAGLVFFFVTRLGRMAHWHAWAMHGGPQGEWKQGPPPWAHHHQHGWGCHEHTAPGQAPEQKAADAAVTPSETQAEK